MNAATPKHILAGDESPEILTLLRDLLEGEGYRVTMTAGPLSLADIKQTRPDLVIVDHMLEEGAGSGWELLRNLRRDPELAGLPVVVCTGAIQQVRENADELDQLGAQVVLKPFDIDRMLEAVRFYWPASASTTPCSEPSDLAVDQPPASH